ncbi:hypothetical protein SAMN05444336_112102 [Albimonas donghaensis]|uniref:Methyltransferase n=1 Tax=Albimonas donghaensis TaxID=356660 RepID=A0A1H3FIP5_9RHOB|nr:hypothetical protein [Albimonas donghaensis]SDX89969.1 hypothetical protein SAMN05444336_112102 [Albimonas donghaensis]
MTGVGNLSTAVRQRRVEAHDSLDDFPTPPWAARALVEALRGSGETDWRARTVWEPAANRGFMVRGLAGAVRSVRASDVHDYGVGFAVGDFLFPGEVEPVDWVITNPPFRLAEDFARRGMEVATIGCALLVRVAFLEGARRYQALFADMPPSRVLQFCERVVMHAGRLPDPDVAEPHQVERDGEAVTVMRKPSTATAYAWLVWERYPAFGRGVTVLDWIPPGTRRRLTRPGDYAPMPEATA